MAKEEGDMSKYPTAPEYLKQYRERTIAGGGLRAREWDHYDELEKQLEPEAYQARMDKWKREARLNKARELSIEDLLMIVKEKQK